MNKNVTSYYNTSVGATIYHYDGNIHREDGPAMIFNNGTKMWYKDGKKHRDNGPAVEFDDGTVYWYQNGKLHREDGPAIEDAIHMAGENNKKWFYRGEEINCTTQEEFEQLIKLKMFW